MTTRTEARAEKSFVSALLPWIIAGLLAIVYLLTINSWISFKNLQAVARASGQTWTPEAYLPLFTLVTSPFHWLPVTWIPIAMNLFSVICAFFVLALLARSVALLPQDRTARQREREQSPFGLLSIPLAWIPPVLAVLVCGLQLTFWENATTLSSGMFDLLLFAYTVRCLLEFRISRRESWLLRATVVYAATATDNWLLIALAPGFLAAMIWLQGFAFFQLRLLARLFLCALAGLLFYLYLPLLHLRSDGLFWLALKANVSAQFSQIEYTFRYAPHHVQFLMALTSLLPILVIAIRWKSSFGHQPIGRRAGHLGFSSGLSRAAGALHLGRLRYRLRVAGCSGKISAPDVKSRPVPAPLLSRRVEHRLFKRLFSAGFPAGIPPQPPRAGPG